MYCNAGKTNVMKAGAKGCTQAVDFESLFPFPNVNMESILSMLWVNAKKDVHEIGINFDVALR